MDRSNTIMGSKNVNAGVYGVLIWVLTCVYVIWQIAFWWRRRHMYLKSWNIPGPFNLPLIGSAYKFICGPEEIYGRIMMMQEKYQPTAKLWFGPKLIYLVSKPHHIERILVGPNTLAKDYLYKNLADVIGTGLMFAPVPLWKAHRKALAPAFNQKMLESFVEIFSQQSQILADKLCNLTGKELDIYTLASQCTLDIILETAMGVKFYVQTDPNQCHSENFDRAMELIVKKIFNIWNHVGIIWELSSNGRELKRRTTYFLELIEKIIEERKEQFIQKQLSGELYTDTGLPKRKAVLDLMLENTNFDDDELRSEVNLLIIAGTDTSASTLSFLFNILAIHPEIQKKVYNEVMDVLGPDRPVEYTDLPQLKYTECVIKETLRLFPVGAFFLRAIPDDLDLGDITIPGGSSVLFGTVFLHRNPEVWPDPLKFDPERFSPENAAKIPPGAYLPFSLGPRNCIGMKYAMMNLKTIIATVVREVKFRSEYKSIAEIPLKANIVLRYKHSSKLYAQRRNS